MDCKRVFVSELALIGTNMPQISLFFGFKTSLAWNLQAINQK